MALHLAAVCVAATVSVAVGVWYGALSWTQAVVLALWLWVGLPAVLLTGSVLHEKVPWRLAAIHSGDWLRKLVAVTTIVRVWRS